MTRQPLYRIGMFAVVMCSIFLPASSGRAQTVTLESICAGGSLTIGDKLFSNFRSFLGAVNGTADAPILSNITATALTDDPLNPGILWEGGNVVTLITGPPAEAEAGEWDTDAA